MCGRNSVLRYSNFVYGLNHYSERIGE